MGESKSFRNSTSRGVKNQLKTIKLGVRGGFRKESCNSLPWHE